MVRRPEGALPQQAAARQQPGDRVQLGRLERLVAGELGQDRGEPPGEHRLAGAGRADHQEVVTAGRGDLERAPRLRLTADLGEIGSRRRPRRGRLDLDPGRVPGASEEPHHVARATWRGDHAQPVDLRRLDGVRRRHHDDRPSRVVRPRSRPR